MKTCQMSKVFKNYENFDKERRELSEVNREELRLQLHSIKPLLMEESKDL